MSVRSVTPSGISIIIISILVFNNIYLVIVCSRTALNTLRSDHISKLLYSNPAPHDFSHFKSPINVLLLGECNCYICKGEVSHYQ